VFENNLFFEVDVSVRQSGTSSFGQDAMQLWQNLHAVPFTDVVWQKRCVRPNSENIRCFFCDKHANETHLADVIHAAFSVSRRFCMCCRARALSRGGIHVD
jgi:hypothetical protein